MLLVNSVITSIAVCHLTTFPADKWFIKKIDKLRRGFLWNAEEETNGGKCLVNWTQVCSPKKFGGLGIKNIEFFGRALRLRWKWFSWDSQERPWKGMHIPCNATDRNLFASSSSITLGNGEKAAFWSDSWLNGKAPEGLAPDLYKLAFRKRLTVKAALANGVWMRGLQRMTSETEMDQFILLWGQIQDVQLGNTPDLVTWNLTADGLYSAASAYEIQFVGRIDKTDLAKVWQLRAEGKIRFFLWLLLQNRPWTADRLEKRGWPHDDACCLCDQTLETAFHFAFQCPYAKEVWTEFSVQEPILMQASGTTRSIRGWWRRIQSRCSGQPKKQSLSVAAYVIWNIWNERNRRIFQDKKMLPKEVARRAREELLQLKAASGY